MLDIKNIIVHVLDIFVEPTENVIVDRAKGIAYVAVETLEFLVEHKEIVTAVVCATAGLSAIVLFVPSGETSGAVVFGFAALLVSGYMPTLSLCLLSTKSITYSKYCSKVKRANTKCYSRNQRYN